VIAGLLKVREALTHFASDHDEALREDALALLDRLIEADRQFAPQRRTPREWMTQLMQSLDTLGIAAGLANDDAGAGLLELFVQLSEDVATCNVKLSMSEWLDWLRMELETARFRDRSIESPIVMTSLEATRFRSFDGVILLGVSESNLPGKAANRAIFNQSVRAMLGLATRAETLNEITHDLFGLFCRSAAQWVSLQTNAAGADEPQNPSPWIAAMVLTAKRNGVHKFFAKPCTQTLPSTGVSAKSASRPAPMLGFGQVPERISASGYQSLVDCPYRYFSRGVLRLSEADEVKEEMEKRDFGELVHEILNRFHQKFPAVSSGDVNEMRSALLHETEAVFAAAIAQNFMAHAWRLQWESAIDDYLAWQRAREGEGWRWHAGEVKNKFPLLLENGANVNVEGRIDRVDWRTGTEMAVIDYKARAVAMLQSKLTPVGEDVQLPVYAALAEAAMPERAVSEAAYLSIVRDGVRAVKLPDVHEAARLHVMRLESVFSGLHAGAPMPAQGVESVCKNCEARGLCRHDYWI
jgi:ATP-dependent helicase/nuclease subunit B